MEYNIQKAMNRKSRSNSIFREKGSSAERPFKLDRLKTT